MRGIVFRLTLTAFLFIALGLTDRGMAEREPPNPEEGSGDHQVTEGEIREIIEGYLLQNFPWEKERVRIKGIGYLGEPPRLPGKFTVEVRTHGTTPLLKKTPFTLIFKVGEKVFKTFVVHAEIEVLLDVLLTARPLKRLQVIDQEDVFLGQRNLTNLSGNVLSDVTSVIGKRVKKSVGAGTPLVEEMIEENPVVRRGDQVLIVTESMGLIITAIGEAMEEGHLGKRIQVMNRASKKRMYGKVMDPETVKVEH